MLSKKITERLAEELADIHVRLETGDLCAEIAIAEIVCVTMRAVADSNTAFADGLAAPLVALDPKTGNAR